VKKEIEDKTVKEKLKKQKNTNIFLANPDYFSYLILVILSPVPITCLTRVCSLSVFAASRDPF
jgi:hypothetical protein